MTTQWYKKQYDLLIKKCKLMEYEGYSPNVYTEVHHILPKCMGGTNDKSNLVRMPIREHIFAHLFLMKANPDNTKLAYSAKMMLCSNKTQERYKCLKYISTSLIAQIREESMLLLKDKNPFKGKKHTKESKKKMSDSHKECYPTLETRKKKSEAVKGEKNPFFGKHHTEETKNLIRQKNSGKNSFNFGKFVKKETREKISRSKLGKKRAPFSKECKEHMSMSKRGGKNNNAKKVIDSGNNIFETVKDAAKYYGVCTDTIRNWCRRKPEKGFRYLN